MKAFAEFNSLIAEPEYDAQIKTRMRELLVVLGVYIINQEGAVRKSSSPRWAWLRKNRGSFDRQPTDKTKDVEITAAGRGDWIGWAELRVEPADETAIRMTGKVIADVDADVIGVVEAEDRPSLVRFDREIVGLYRNVMLVDGNDTRGIDVGIMTKGGFEIDTMGSHVDDEDDDGNTIFSRDCADYRVKVNDTQAIHVLVNHFKSQSGGGGDRRKAQAERVREIVDDLVAAGESGIVLGDLNEGQADEQTPSPNFAKLFDPNGPLVSCFDLPNFDPGPRPARTTPAASATASTTSC